MRCIAALIWVIVMMGACTDTLAQTLREENIARRNTRNTDPAIAGWTANHVVIVNTDAPMRRRVYLFMHGLGGSGGGAREPLRAAACDGFPAIGLIFPNDWAPFSLCSTGGAAGSDCYDNLHRIEFPALSWLSPCAPRLRGELSWP